MTFSWLNLYLSRQPLILKLSFFWLLGLVFGFQGWPLPLVVGLALFSGWAWFRFSRRLGLYVFIFFLAVGRMSFAQTAEMNLAEWKRIQVFAPLRRTLMEAFARNLPEPEASLAAGMVLGQKRALPSSFAKNMRRVGLTHLVVASGYNIFVVVSFIGAIAFFLGRRLSLVFAFLAAVFYGFLAGGDWPVWRALLMAGIFLAAKIGGRESEGLTALGAVAALLTLLDPLSLKDLSFQLSFFATLGLILFAEPLEELLTPVLPWPLRNWRALRSGLAVTLAAQAAAWPLLLFHFREFSLAAPLANLLTFAVIPILMVFGLFLLLAHFLFPPLQILAAALAYLPLTYIARLASYFGELPWVSLRF